MFKQRDKGNAQKDYVEKIMKEAAKLQQKINKDGGPK